MVIIKKEGVILEATEREFENQAVLNPTVLQKGNNNFCYQEITRCFRPENPKSIIIQQEREL